MDYEQKLTDLADASGDVKSEDLMGLLLGGSPGEGDTARAPAPADAPAEPAAAPAGSTDDTTPKPKEGEPAPAAAPAAAAPAAPEPKPVLLAKDGVHTISYDKLEEARNQAATAKAEAQALREQLAALTTTKEPTPAAPAPVDGDPSAAEPKFGDYSDESLAKGVKAIVDAALAEQEAKFNAKLTPLERKAGEEALTQHYATIFAKHPDAESIVVSTEFEAWKAAQPAFVRSGIEQTQQNGGPQAMVEVLDLYRSAHPRAAATAPVAAPAPAASATAPAAASAAALASANAAIENAKTRTPNSLTDIPAGTQAHHDETDAMASMNPVDLMNKFGSMSPEEINKTLARIL